MPGTSTSFLSRAQQHIEEREYWASESARGLQTPNRRHGFRTYYTSEGIEVVDRTSALEEVLLGLELTGIGRVGSPHETVEPGRVTSEMARVEIDHGSVIEWYVNGPAGLEQGFTLDRRIAGEGEVVVAVGVRGATVERRGPSIRLTSGAGRSFRYGKLHAFDAAGRELPTRLAARDEHSIGLFIDDRGAEYPIVIDPLLTGTTDTELEGDQFDARFGFRVSGAGDVNGDGYADVIVGASRYDAGEIDEGAAFVFLGGPGGIADGNPASAHAQLESDQADAQLGHVAGAGDINGDGYDDVIVGAQFYDAGEVDEGAAFLFLGGAAGIADGDPTTAHAQLEADEAAAEFGITVAGAGDVNGDGYDDVIVGAIFYDAGGSDEGAAFLFLGSASGISDGDPSSADAIFDGDQTSARFGQSVESAGDVNGDGYDDIIIGASDYDSPTAEEGAAFIFHGSASGIASGNPLTADTQLEGDQATAVMGASVAGAGDINGDGYDDVIVGAPLYDAPPAFDGGAAFIFLGGPSGVADAGSGAAHATIPGDGTLALTGGSVAAAGDVNGDGYDDVVIGGILSEMGNGGTYVFLGSETGIASGGLDTAYAVFTYLNTFDGNGSAVSGAGDVNGDGFDDIITGASTFDDEDVDEGAVFILHGGPGGLAVGDGIPDGDPSSADTRFEANQANADMGYSVAGAGDVNGDGFSDVIVGARRYDAGQGDEGAAFIFHGDSAGIADATPAAADTQLESDQANARMGRSVAGAGDVNGDGYHDVIVGAPGYDSVEIGEGAAFIFLGSATGVADGNPTTAHAHLEANQLSASMGESVAGAGDINGDGYDDVIVGADGYVVDSSLEGAAFIFLGSASGVADGDPTNAHAQIEGDQTSALLGSSVSGAGDVNADGYDDVIVGAPGFAAPTAGEGAAFVFLGSPTGIADGNPTTAHAQFESDQTSGSMGRSVAGAGDVNGDGYDDVIVGAHLYSAGESQEGAAFVYLGSSSGFTSGNASIADTQLESDQVGSRMGWSVASAGDVNGDGFSDVIVGAYLYAAPDNQEGAAWVFLGSASGVADGNPVTAHAQLEANQANAQLGHSVSGAGDVDGNGYDDVIVGAKQYSAGESEEGAAFLFLAAEPVPEPSVAAGLLVGWGLVARVHARRVKRVAR